MKRIELKNIRKSYSAFELSIEKLNFAQGKLYCLTGPNGSGKSTLLGIISLLDKDFKGELFFDQFKIHSLAKKRRSALRKIIGFLAQDDFLFSGSVLYNVTYGLRVRGYSLKEAKSILSELAEALRIKPFYQREVDTLSGGERQRVKILQALSFNPRILLLDEPMTGVDNLSKKLIKDLLQNTDFGKNKIIIMTLHNLDQAYELSDNVICLNDGQIENFTKVNLLIAKDISIAPIT